MIKQFSTPLKTKGLRISIQTKNWLFQSGDFEKYKYYRNKICFSDSLNQEKLLFQEQLKRYAKNMASCKCATQSSEKKPWASQ